MRLLFVCPDMDTGGAQRQWATLVPALHARGIEVRVVCFAQAGALFGELEHAGVPAVCLNMRGRGDLSALRRALAEAGGRPDAVVTRAVSPQLVGEAIARRAGARHVLSEHTPLTPEGELLPARPHQRLLLRLVAPRVDRVIAVAERQIDPLVRIGYRRERIVVVPNGLFPADGSGSAPRDETRRALGLFERDFAVLCLAGLRPEKRVDAFLEAVALARERVPALRGLVAGDGPERARLERLAGEWAGTRLLGARGDAPELILAADAVCLPSEAEALPMSLLEAMALGRPVVAADVGGAAEAIVHGQVGLIVPPGDAAATADALMALARAPERARAMGERGRARQRARYGGEAMVDGYVRELEAALR